MKGAPFSKVPKKLKTERYEIIEQNFSDSNRMQNPERQNEQYQKIT